MAANTGNPDREQAARIVALFSVFIHAWQSNDFAEAARVLAELQRYGVNVRILGRPHGRQEGGT